jgi:hypothetical protein
MSTAKVVNCWCFPQPLHEIQTRARAEQETAEWRERYALRVGCEATVSETAEHTGFAAAATAAWRRPTFSMSSPLPALTSFGSASTAQTVDHGQEPHSSSYAARQRKHDPLKDHQQHPEIAPEPNPADR